MITDEELLKIYELKNLVRYNNKTRLKDESVAEHTFYVALISLILCDEMQVDDDITLLCLIKSLLHDMPEIEMNDITYDVKTRLNLESFLKSFEDMYYSKNFPTFAKSMSDGQGIVDAIVNLADALSVRQFTLHEIELGNRSKDMSTIFESTADRIEKLKRRLEDETNK